MSDDALTAGPSSPEEDLASSEAVDELLRQLVDARFVLTDRDGAVTRWSVPAEELFGWPPPGCSGGPWYAVARSAELDTVAGRAESAAEAADAGAARSSDSAGSAAETAARSLEASGAAEGHADRAGESSGAAERHATRAGEGAAAAARHAGRAGEHAGDAESHVRRIAEAAAAAERRATEAQQAAASAAEAAELARRSAAEAGSEAQAVRPRGRWAGLRPRLRDSGGTHALGRPGPARPYPRPDAAAAGRAHAQRRAAARAARRFR